MAEPLFLLRHSNGTTVFPSGPGSHSKHNQRQIKTSLFKSSFCSAELDLAFQVRETGIPAEGLLSVTWKTSPSDCCVACRVRRLYAGWIRFQVAASAKTEFRSTSFLLDFLTCQILTQYLLCARPCTLEIL